MRNAILSFRVNSLMSLSSDFRFGLAGVGIKLRPFPKAMISVCESFALDRFVMNDLQCSAKVCLFSNWLVRFLVLHIPEKRLAFSTFRDFLDFWLNFLLAIIGLVLWVKYISVVVNYTSSWLW